MAIRFDNIEAINLQNHAATNVLTLNSSNTNALFAGNVGIGMTSAPAERLHVYGSVDNDDVAIRIQNASDDNSSLTPPSAAVVFATASNNGYIRVFGAPADTAANHRMDIGSTAGSSYLTFSPSTTEKMRIANNGYVGIGQTDPSRLLHLKADSAGAIITLQRGNSNSGGSYGALQWTASDNHTVSAIDARSDGDNEGAHLLFHTTSAASADDPYGISERMRITSDGNVEIGDKNYVFGGDNYHIALKSTVNSQDQTTYLSNIEGTMVISAGGYYYGSARRNLNASNTTYGGLRLAEDGDFRLESISGATAGSDIAEASTTFNVNSTGVTTSYGTYIRSQYDGNNYAQIENNSSGGVLKAVDGGTATVLFRSYGDSYITNDLGIGVTSPAGRLHVDAPSTKAVSLTYGAETGQIFTNENSEFAFGLHNNGPYPLYIQGRTHVNTARQIVLNPLGGNVGVGTLNPEKELEVDGDVKADAFIGQRVIVNGNAYHGTANTVFALYSAGAGMSSYTGPNNNWHSYAAIIMPFNGVVEKIIIKNIKYSSYTTGPSASGTARVLLNQYDSTYAPADYSSGNVSFTAAANVSMTFSPDEAYNEGTHFRVLFNSSAVWRYISYQIILKQTS